MTKGPGRHDRTKVDEELTKSGVKELPVYNSDGFVKLFLEYCIGKGAKVFRVVAPPSYEEIREDGVKIETTPAVTLEPINDIKDTDFTTSSLFVRADEGDYLIFSSNSEQKNIPQKTLYFNPELVKILWTSIHVYRKEDIPQTPRPRELQALRTTGSGIHMQYIRRVGKFKDGSAKVFEDELSIFPEDDAQDSFLTEFMNWIKDSKN